MNASAFAELERALVAGEGEHADRLLAVLGETFADDPRWLALAARRAIQRGDAQDALGRLALALRRDPRHAPAWIALGGLYRALGQAAEAEIAFRRALAVDARIAAAWSGLAAALDEQGDPAAAAAAHGEAAALAPLDPTPRLQQAAALVDAGRIDDALDVLDALGDVGEPGAAAFVRGSAWAARGDPGKAADAFRASVDAAPQRAEAWANLALALDEVGRRADALAAADAALARDPALSSVLAQRVFLARRLADWRELPTWSARLTEAVASGAPGITPFSFLAEPSTPEAQRRCAETWAAQRLAASERWRRGTAPPPAVRASGRPRVGFLSSGFGNHPTALLTVELFERLRGGALEIVGYATTPDDGGALRRRIARAVDRFQELAGLPHPAMVRRIREDGIDVLVDLRGYGGGAVTEVFAARAAPLQVNWLAYPGTSGAPFIDWLIADAVVVPASERAHYSEALLRLPHAFQPSDTTRAVPEPPARADCGLPPRGPVFASFNNGYKIGPEVFATWMAVLRDVPAATLWLLADPDPAFATNLGREAAAAGVDPQRLVFQPKRPHPDYLARYRHADLFLDTWPYGAHTTASDALWAGCPVLTCPGRTFASRVATSLLTALGLPELVARDAGDYRDRAVALAREPGALAALRERLATARRSSPLFDMGRFARDMERALLAMIERARRGLPPADLDLAP